MRTKYNYDEDIQENKERKRKIEILRKIETNCTQTERKIEKEINR